MNKLGTEKTNTTSSHFCVEAKKEKKIEVKIRIVVTEAGKTSEKEAGKRQVNRYEDTVRVSSRVLCIPC